MRVLDLDLDFFVTPTPFGLDTEPGERADPERFSVAGANEVSAFCETALGLSKARRIRGGESVTHDGAFWYWKSQLEAGTLRAPFEVIHVDNHADLGMGDSGWLCITADLLHRPLEERGDPPRDQVQEGNYLAFAIAAGWIASVTYVAPPCRFASDGSYRRDDRIRSYFVDEEPGRGVLSLPVYPRGTTIVNYPCAPVRHEPSVPFRTVNASTFVTDGNFASAFLAHSPHYTPVAADVLIPQLHQYLALEPVG